MASRSQLNTLSLALVAAALLAVAQQQQVAGAAEAGALPADLEEAAELKGRPEEDVSTSGAQDDDESGPLQKQSIWTPLELLWPQRARENPDFFLVGLKPYEQFIPEQIQEMINQQVRPITEQMSAQIIQAVPGSEAMYQQLQQFMNLFQNFNFQQLLGGLGGGGGSGGSSSSGGNGRGNGNSAGLSGLIPGLGRRR